MKMNGLYKLTKQKLRPDFFINKYDLDFSTSVMEEYYPVDMHRARVLRGIGIQVYRFDIQGVLVKRYKVRNNHTFYRDRYYGVLKTDWDQFVKSEKSYPFIYLWYMASAEANDFIEKEMMIKQGLMSGRFNSIYIDETNMMDDYLEENAEKQEALGLPERVFTVKKYADEIWKYLPLLAVEYANRLYDEAVYCDEKEDINILLLRMSYGLCERLVRYDKTNE